MSENSIQKSDATNNSLMSSTSLDELNSIVAWGEVISKSGLTPLKKGSDVAVAVLLGRELGLSPIVSIQHIFAVSGKASMSVALQAGIVAKAGITTEIIEDFVPLYGYKDARSTVQYTQRQVDDNFTSFKVVSTKAEIDECATKGIVPLVKSLNPTDYRTTVKMTRVRIDKEGKPFYYHIQRSRNRSDYSHLLDKDNWKNYPADLLMARVKGIVIREIAADLFATTGGVVYTTDELNDDRTVNVESEIVFEQTNTEFKAEPIDHSNMDILGAKGEIVIKDDIEDAQIEEVIEATEINKQN